MYFNKSVLIREGLIVQEAIYEGKNVTLSVLLNEEREIRELKKVQLKGHLAAHTVMKRLS